MNIFAKRWSSVPLRDKITGVTVCMLFFGLVIAGVGTLSLLRPALVSSQESELRQLQSDPTPVLQPGTDLSQITRESIENARRGYYVGVLDANGALLFDNSQVLPKNRVPRELRLPEDSKQRPVPDSILRFSSEDGTEWHAVIVPVRMGNSLTPNAHLIIAVSDSFIRTIIAQYITIFSGFGLTVIFFGATITRLLVSNTFEPLYEVERTAQEIAEGDFSKRIHVTNPHTEVGHLGTSLNVMLNNIDQAFRDRAESIEQMRRFIGDAGHELRTPLVSVRGYAELYRMGALSTEENVSQAFERIEKEAIRMTSLVEDLLFLARLNEGRALEMKALDINAFARDAAFDARAQAPDREIVAVECEQTPMALGDEHKIRQVMTNLFGNALRHTPDGTPIEIVVSSIPGFARFEIRDHGEGIPVQFREKIFQRFWRADNSRTRETGGSGLGLAIVTSIVQSHHGKIEALETAGGGATFRVDLPLAEPEEFSEGGAEAKASATSVKAAKTAKAQKAAKTAKGKELKTRQKQPKTSSFHIFRGRSAREVPAPQPHGELPPPPAPPTPPAPPQSDT